ncbi:LHX3 [Cordylochernes scorpioides]|uniref:LHX3 n=1 Tax=Cordylochernes scorpioides TaxID=51811 RepID=A0ABY6LAR6_9ARAC|nr:LHX3 [Cordylochernes scorpioides]
MTTPCVRSDMTTAAQLFHVAAGGDKLRPSPFLLATIPKCAGCETPILDRFILKVLDRSWHSRCLRCADCQTPLADKCFARSGQVFCREDFFSWRERLRTDTVDAAGGSGPSVRDANKGSRPAKWYVGPRTMSTIFTASCASSAKRQLNTGDQFYLMEDCKLVCKHDYEAAKSRVYKLRKYNNNNKPLFRVTDPIQDSPEVCIRTKQ